MVSALHRMALREQVVLASVLVERVSLFGWKIDGEVGEAAWAAHKLELMLAGSIPAVQTSGEAGAEPSAEKPRRVTERLLAGAPETAARVAELRHEHGRRLRVTGVAGAKRARWTGREAWVAVSYPVEE